MSVAARAAVVGIVVGAALEALTVLFATTGPVGEGWSFRGNGALVVPIGFGAATLAGGWLGIALYARGTRAWATIGVAVGIVALTPSLLSILLLVFFGSAAQRWSDLMTIPIFAGPVLSALAVIVSELWPAATRRLPRGHALLVLLAFTLALAIGYAGPAVALGAA